MPKTALILSCVFGAGLFFIIHGNAVAATADHLVISQVQITGGAGKTTNDFVEIYNPTSADIDLKGMRLVKRTKTGATDSDPIKSWSSSAIVKAHGYYLWANSSYTDIAATPDVTTTDSIANDNGIAIRNGPSDTGAIIDAVAWGTAANAFVEGTVFATNPEAAAALERKPGGGAGNGEDTNDNASDFFLQTASHPRNSASAVEPALSSLPPPSPSPQGGGNSAANPPAFNLQITEIVPNPRGADSGAEWVEFYNPAAAAFDLSGWILDDDSTQTDPGSGYYPIAAPAVVPAGGYLAIIIPAGRFALNNTGEEAVRLFDSGKLMRLRQAFTGPAKDGQSYALIGGTWIWSASPTPGAANTAVAAATTAAGTLKISEVLPNPPGDDLEGEFIEVFNYGDEAVELSGWTIADARKRYEIAAEDFGDTEIPPRSYFVLWRETTGISLNNTGEEEVKLFDPAGALIDKIVFDAADYGEQAYAWSAGAAWSWTITATLGKENMITAPEQREKAAQTKAKPKVEEVKQEQVEIKQMELAAVRGLPIGTLVNTSGVVVVEPGLLGKQVSYLQGSGIRILLPVDSSLFLSPGTKIAFTAEVTQFHNEQELKISDGSIEIMVQDLEIAPRVIKTGEVGEATEGHLVNLNGEITSQSGDTFYIDDGSSEARILIAESTGIVKPKIKKGEQVAVTGVVTQWDNVYRVMPRYQSDLVLSQVLGETAAGKTLPRTGIDFWLMLAVFPAVVVLLKQIINIQQNE